MSDSPPAPRITSPAPADQVDGNKDLAVGITTNQPGLPHEVTLLDANFMVVQTVMINPPVPGSVVLRIPPAGGGTQFYIAIGVPPGVAEEQTRHVIKVTVKLVGPPPPPQPVPRPPAPSE